MSDHIASPEDSALKVSKWRFQRFLARGLWPQQPCLIRGWRWPGPQAGRKVPMRSIWSKKKWEGCVCKNASHTLALHQRSLDKIILKRGMAKAGVQRAGESSNSHHWSDLRIGDSVADRVSLVYFCFCGLFFWYHIHGISARSSGILFSLRRKSSHMQQLWWAWRTLGKAEEASV